MQGRVGIGEKGAAVTARALSSTLEDDLAPRRCSNVETARRRGGAFNDNWYACKAGSLPVTRTVVLLVMIARHGKGWAGDECFDRAARFGGQSEVTVPPGVRPIGETRDVATHT
jgi:hypothetical protein